MRTQSEVHYVNLQISDLGCGGVKAHYGLPRDKHQYGADHGDRLMVLRGAEDEL